LEDSHVQHRGDLQTLRGQVESGQSVDDQMGCLLLDMEALKQRLPLRSNPDVVGRLEDRSVTLKNSLQVLQVENTDYKDAAAAELASKKMEEADAFERASIEMEAAATKIQRSARGLMARKLASERMEEVAAAQRANTERAVADIPVAASDRQVTILATSEHQVTGTESVVERQNIGVESAITKQQVPESEDGKPRSLWDRLTSRISSQAAGSEAFQGVISKATPLRMTIVSARGLRVADWTSGEGKSDPYCICELKGKSRASKIQTQVVEHDLDPAWNHEGVLNDYTVGDSLVFKIYDVDYILLGSLELPSNRFHPHGFEGELHLKDAGEDGTGVLSLKIEPTVDMKDDPAFEAAGKDWVAEY